MCDVCLRLSGAAAVVVVLQFLHNSADDNLVYHPSWAILDGADPSKVLARADAPLLVPDQLWEKGSAPWTCNVPNVVFLEAAAPTDEPDTFRVRGLCGLFAA